MIISLRIMPNAEPTSRAITTPGAVVVGIGPRPGFSSPVAAIGGPLLDDGTPTPNPGS